MRAPPFFAMGCSTGLTLIRFMISDLVANTLSTQPLQSHPTGLLAWKHGQPGQVGNEAALTVVTSAEIRLVNLISCDAVGIARFTESARLFESHHALVAQGA